MLKETILEILDVSSNILPMYNIVALEGKATGL